MPEMKEKAVKLLKDLLAICVVVAKDAHKFIGENAFSNSAWLLDKYPHEITSVFYDDHYFKVEDREKVPFLKYKLVKYGMSSYPDDKICYSTIFREYRSKKLDLKEYTKIEEIQKWINSDKALLNCFTDKDELPDYLIRRIVADVVERYLYMTNASASEPEDLEDKIKDFLIEKMWFYLEDELSFDICIPICLATFEDDNIKLDDRVEIVKIPEDVQIARQIQCSYEVNKEDWVAACATHMIVLHGYNYRKSINFTFNSIMQDFSCYPLEKIDEIFGIIRIVTGYAIGYEQIFCIPNGWVHDTIADVKAIYGAKAHFVNPHFLQYDWMALPVSFVTEEQCKEIVDHYSSYCVVEKKLKFALMRFNRCMLRDEIDDMTTDACIGLESLLAGGAHSEITNAIASRIPFVFANTQLINYQVSECRKYMKKIYNLRSRIVHGDELKDKDIYITKDDDKIYIPQIAVDFLRVTLSFMIKNPMYQKVEKIDEYVDNLLQNP